MDRLTNATVLVNNVAVAIVPNSLKFTEGLGEQTMDAASIGGGKVEQVFSEDVETAFGKVMFEIPATPDNIASAKAWKVRRNTNVVQIAGSNAEGNMTRSFTQAALLADYEVPISTEGNIPLEFSSNAPI